jgi:hypothetical protein
MPSSVDGNNVRMLCVAPSSAAVAYAATTGGVYKTADGGVSWLQMAALGSRQIEAIAMDTANENVLLAGKIFGGIWITQDGGSTWSGPHTTGFNSSNPYISAIGALPGDPDVWFCSDLYSGIYRSLDKGLTWSGFPDWVMSGLDVRAVTAIDLDDTVLYAATQGGGVFRYPLWKDRHNLDNDADVDLADVLIMVKVISGQKPEIIRRGPVATPAVTMENVIFALQAVSGIRDLP